MRKVLIVVFLIICNLISYSQSFTINVTNPPVFSNTALNITEAGNDFSVTSITSSTNTNLTIGPFWSSGNYRISAYLVNSISPLILEVDITSSNLTWGSIITDYTNPPVQLVQNNPKPIVDASKFIFNNSYTLSFTLKNFSVVNPAGLQNLQIQFTVTDIN